MNEAQRPAAFITSPPRKVLFLCAGNSARSQMAEGFARSVAPPEAVVMSAGVRARPMHALAVQVMQEVGIDISGQRCKTLEEVPWQEADTVVSLCGEAEIECPPLGPTVRRVHWPLPDPAAAPEKQRIEAFREIREEIRWRLSSLWPRTG
jgi:arsenate reductase